MSAAELIRENSTLDFALSYARAGFSVLPVHRVVNGRCTCGKDCETPGKHPRTLHGSKDAATDPATITAWWTRWPDANIGMALADLVVVDIDPRNGGDVDALPRRLPDTCYAKTGGGGWHYLYRAHNGTKYPGDLGAGIDVKTGAGAYIVVEPSVHASGQKYCWLDETEPWSTVPTEAPDWLARSSANGSGEPAADTTDSTLRAAVQTGAGGVHAALVSLAARYIGRGMAPADATAALAGLLEACEWRERDPDRWRARYASIGGLVASAAAKFSDRRERQDAPGCARTRATAPDEGTHQEHIGDAPGEDMRSPINADDFYSVLPVHKYLYVPTRDLWPSESIDGRLTKSARNYLDTKRAVVQMTWHPDEPLIISNRVVADGGWVRHQGVNVINLYRAPNASTGTPAQADRWRAHLREIYPDDAKHIEYWLAHRIQRPGQKINHALVLGGAQGIGKDTLLEPVKHGVGPWNWSEISPGQMLGRFNGWAKAVVVRVSEARDLGDVDRFALYDHSKGYIAAPPDVIRVDEKNLREHPVFNVVGVIITTNHKTDGIYLPADDRRHFVAWSERCKDDFSGAYWTDLWEWYAAGGTGHVVAFLRSLDLAGFDPKAPPPKTPAFFAIVAAGSAPEDAELRDALDRAGNPDALTLELLVTAAQALGLDDLVLDLGSKGRRALPHKMERVGFVPVRNPDADDGLFKIGGRRRVVYAKRTLTTSDQIRAARRVVTPEPDYGQSGRRSQ